MCVDGRGARVGDDLSVCARVFVCVCVKYSLARGGTQDHEANPAGPGGKPW